MLPNPRRGSPRRSLRCASPPRSLRPRGQPQLPSRGDARSRPPCRGSKRTSSTATTASSGLRAATEPLLVDGYATSPTCAFRPDGTVRGQPALAGRRTSTRTASRRATCRRAPTAGRRRDWQIVARTGRYEWHDHRIHWMAKGACRRRSRTTAADEGLRLDACRCASARGRARSAATLTGLGRGRRRPAGRPRSSRWSRRCCSAARRARASRRRRRRRPRRASGRGLVRRALALALALLRARARRRRVAHASSRRPRRRAARCSKPRPQQVDASLQRGRRGELRRGARVRRARRARGRGRRPRIRAATPTALGRRPEPRAARRHVHRDLSRDLGRRHPVSGGFVFSVGRGRRRARGDRRRADRRGRGRPGDRAPPSASCAGSSYLAIALAVGGLAFLLVVWLPALRAAGGAGADVGAASAGFAARCGVLAAVAVGLGVLASVLGIVLQGANAAGIDLWAALDPAVLGDVLGTRFGKVWAPAAARLAAARRAAARRPWRAPHPVCARRRSAPPAWRPGRPAPAALALLALPLGFLVLSPALAGHAGAHGPGRAAGARRRRCTCSR